MTKERKIVAAESSVNAQPINSYSRYYQHAFYIINENGLRFRTLESWERPDVPDKLEEGSRYFYVTSAFAHRPDKIAQQTLGSSQYWWWIMLVNGLIDVRQLVAGITLQISFPPYNRPQKKKFIF